MRNTKTQLSRRLVYLSYEPHSELIILAAGVSKQSNINGTEFSGLPSVGRELDEISHITLKNRTLLDEALTYPALRESLEEYLIVHLATHFYFDVANPNESFLLFGNGKLTIAQMNEADNLFGNTDLLVLSAANTQLIGSSGKEVEGLAYIAQNLGAKSVISTLWNVSDVSTSELFREFYTRLQSKARTMTKAQALRHAQIALLYGSTKPRKEFLKKILQAIQK